MDNYKVEYTVSEVRDYFKNEIRLLKNNLAYLVKNKKIKPEDARKKYDMYLNCYEFLEILLRKEEAESFLRDRTFSIREIYRKDTTSDSLLIKIAKKI